MIYCTCMKIRCQEATGVAQTPKKRNNTKKMKINKRQNRLRFSINSSSFSCFSCQATPPLGSFLSCFCSCNFSEARNRQQLLQILVLRQQEDYLLFIPKYYKWTILVCKTPFHYLSFCLTVLHNHLRDHET